MKTERYVPGTDWNTHAPQLINNALDHLSECLTREGRLLEHVAGGVTDNATDTTTKKRTEISTALTKLLGESRHLHTQLMDRFMGARGTFLDAQDHQMFRPTTKQAHEIEFRADPEPLASHEALVAAHEDLARVQLPIRLSALLQACPDDQPAGATAYDLFVAASLRAFDNSQRDTDQDHHPGDWAEEADDAYEYQDETGSSQKRVVHLLDVPGPDAACVADDTKLVGDGWAGDDLVLCVDRDQLDAVLLDELPYPEPTPLRIRARAGGTR